MLTNEKNYFHALQINPKLLAKLPTLKLKRILSLSNELRKIQKSYWWFHHNAIVIDLENVRGMKKVSVLICATVTNYKVRVDFWPYATQSEFIIHEFDSENGNALLFALVNALILEASFLPSISVLHSKLNDL